MTVLDRVRKRGYEEFDEFGIDATNVRNPKRICQLSTELASPEQLSLNLSRQVVDDVNAFGWSGEMASWTERNEQTDAGLLINTLRAMALKKKGAAAWFVQQLGQPQSPVPAAQQAVVIIETRQPASFVDHAQRLAKRGQIDAALDVIYDRADEMMLAGEFEPLDQVIAALNPAELSVDIMLGVLTVTSPARSKLPARSEFFKNVKATLQDRGELADGLLTGLE